MDKIVIAKNNMPSSVDKDKMAELYTCVVQDGGVFLTESQDQDYYFPIFGEYKRSPGVHQENQITSVLLRPMASETKRYYLRVSEKCPWRYPGPKRR